MVSKATRYVTSFLHDESIANSHYSNRATALPLYRPATHLLSLPPMAPLPRRRLLPLLANNRFRRNRPVEPRHQQNGQPTGTHSTRRVKHTTCSQSSSRSRSRSKNNVDLVCDRYYAPQAAYAAAPVAPPAEQKGGSGKYGAVPPPNL